MTQKDQDKLLQAGFVIIRADEQGLRIKQKTKERDQWHVLYKDIKNKAELERRMSLLLTHKYIIAD